MRHGRSDYQERIIDTLGPHGAGAIPEDEPVLLLRGQDVYAWRAALAYADLVKPHARRVSDTVRRLVLEMKAWAATHGKVPDIPEDVRAGWEEAIGTEEATDQVDPPMDPADPGDEAAVAAGWASKGELLEAVGALDLSADGARGLFETWRDEDGTKAGFAALEGAIAGGGA